MLKSVCYAPFLQWSVQQQIVLFIRSLCSLPTTVCKQWEILYVRSLCSLPSLLICTVVSQVALLPSYNSKATVSLQIVCQVTLLSSYNSEAIVSLLCLLPVPILFQYILIYLNLFWIYLNFIEFLSEKQGHVTKLLGHFWVSSHYPTCDAAYILD